MRTDNNPKNEAERIKEETKESLAQISKALFQIRREAYHIENVLECLVNEIYEEGEFDWNSLEHYREEQNYYKSVAEAETELLEADKLSETNAEKQTRTCEDSADTNDNEKKPKARATAKTTKNRTEGTKTKGTKSLKTLTPLEDAKGHRIRIGDKVKFLKKGLYRSTQGIVYKYSKHTVTTRDAQGQSITRKPCNVEIINP